MRCDSCGIRIPENKAQTLSGRICTACYEVWTAIIEFREVYK